MDELKRQIYMFYILNTFGAMLYLNKSSSIQIPIFTFLYPHTEESNIYISWKPFGNLPISFLCSSGWESVTHPLQGNLPWVRSSRHCLSSKTNSSVTAPASGHSFNSWSFPVRSGPRVWQHFPKDHEECHPFKTLDRKNKIEKLR